MTTRFVYVDDETGQYLECGKYTAENKHNEGYTVYALVAYTPQD